MSKMIGSRMRVVPTGILSTFTAVICATALCSSIAFSQEPTEEVKQLPPVVVTGSLIPTTAEIGAQPLERVTAAEISETPAADPRQALKLLSTSFSGNVNLGQEVNNGGNGEANVAIHNLPTLVLLNGRRLGDTALSAGASTTGNSFVDVNTIPLAMIERIEVLKDGASAVYGSGAIGGVVNIITKHEYNGVETASRWGTATGDGTFVQRQASVVAGVGDENNWFTAVAQYFHQDPLKTRDRKLLSLDSEQLANHNIGFVSYISPSFPGKVQSGPGNSQPFFLAGSPFLQGQPGYNPAITTPPIVPGGPFSGANAVANYNAAAIANGYVDPTGNGLGPYAPGTLSPLLNTTQFGTHSIQEQDRRQFFGIGEHELMGKELSIFGQFLYANTISEAQLAPAPVISLFDSRIFVPADNVWNPFGIDLGPVGGAAAPRIRSRFIQSGNREFESQSDYYHFTGGLKGEFETGYTYNFAYTYNRADQTETTKNAINGAALDAALTPNPDPALAAQGISSLRGPSGTFVPQYNIFFTPIENYPTRQGPNSQETIDAITTSLFEDGVSEEWNASFVVTGEPYELPAGKISFATGGGFEDDSLSLDYDGLTRIGKVPGLNAQEPTSGTRHSYNLFIETRIPLTSPDMDVPLLHSLEVTAAGRFESFDPGGDDAVPKVTIRWQPFDDQVLLRGSYSQSFIAPTTAQLFGGAAENNPFLVVQGDAAQLTTLNGSNPNLDPIKANTYTCGIVITPKAIPNLTVSVDYYYIQVNDDIFRLSEQSIADDLNANGSDSEFAQFFFFDDATQLVSPAPNQITINNWGALNVPLANGAQEKTDGLDLAGNYRLPTDEFGTFNFWAVANILFSFKVQDPLIGGPFEYAGKYTDDANGIGGAQGLLPTYQVNTGLSWQYKGFTYAINARYIPQVEDPGTLFPSVGSPVNDFTVNGKPFTIDSWYSIDMQIAYEFGKNQTQRTWYGGTRVALGCNNITNENPPLIASSFEDNTDKSTYDVVGRFVYFEVGKKF